MIRKIVSVGLLVALAITVIACRPTADSISQAPAGSTSQPVSATAAATAMAFTATATPEAATTAGPSATPAATPTDTPLPTATTQPSPTPIPSATPTPLPQLAPAFGFAEAGTVREGLATPATAIPTPVATFQVPSDTTNVLLLGSDMAVASETDRRTDTMIIVSINRQGPTASMIALPRDLFVYLPRRSMYRLNTAILLGGVDLLKETILYNFGVPIHYYARVDFEGFQEIVDTMGGVEIDVSCRLEDWRLKEPGLDIEDEDNWAKFALEPGVYKMDGDTALWYARSRLSSSDFDRGRRQQQLLRGMFNQAIDLNLVAQAPALWQAFQGTVETDMDIGRMLQLAALAPAVRENGVQNLYLQGRTIPWVVPEDGAQVQLPIWDGPFMMKDTFSRLFQPPALNRANRAPILVEVVNASGSEDLATLAADNLAWYGFVPVINPAEVEAAATTEIEYYAPNLKGSYNWLLTWVMDRAEADTVLVDQEYPYDYRVVLGQDYDPCRPAHAAPQLLLNQ